MSWRETVKKHYGARSSHKWHQIFADITSVLLGLKPSLLLDCLPTDALRFRLFVQEVLPLHWGSVDRHADLIPKLCILKVSEDVLLVNMDCLRCEYNSGNSDLPYPSPEFVKITKGVHLPLLASEEEHSAVNKQLAVWYKALLQQITESPDVLDSAAQIPIVNNNDDINRCTLFGWLLNYPVVYWFDPEIGYNLSMVDLVCHTVTVHPTPAEASKNLVQRSCMLEKVSEQHTRLVSLFCCSL